MSMEYISKILSLAGMDAAWLEGREGNPRDAFKSWGKLGR